MPIFLSNLKGSLDEPERSVVNRALKLLSVEKNAVRAAFVSRRSVDARRRSAICFVYTVRVELSNAQTEAAVAARCKAAVYKPVVRCAFASGDQKPDGEIVVVGLGPAGLFAALTLAQNGYRPLVLERGAEMDRRMQAVERFWSTGALDLQTNVQFGEGGAGTFSDGKLTTRISDPFCETVLETFYRHGAPADTLKKAKPHLGTDRLRHLVRSIRAEIVALGGRVLFEHTLDGVGVQNGILKSITVNGDALPVQAVVLATGHSARDTFSMLAEQGVPFESKPFSVGARIEQRQEVIDFGLYGKRAGHPALPAGEYQFSYRENGRGVYTFCMCPGGRVVAGSSEPESVLTNGMSDAARDGKNANAALVVSVDGADFGSSPFAGVEFQRRLERAAFQLAGRSYAAPAATADAFLENRAGLHLGSVVPTYPLGVTAVDFRSLLPDVVVEMMQKGLRRFGGMLPGFCTDDLILTGPETRTSSPVRIPRSPETGMAVSVENLYPCGEGAGYAGGIMSAAVDGIRQAGRIIERFSPREADRKK